MKTGTLLYAAAALAVAAPGLRAQGDVELLGMVYGTRPPDAYFQRLLDDPEAYRFARAWKARLLRSRAAPAPGGAADAGPAGVLGRRDGAVAGTFRFPLVLGLFADSDSVPPFATPEIQREFFDGPNSRHATIPEFYDEISGGRVQLVGTTLEWERVELTGAEVAGGSSGLGNGARVGEYIVQILTRLDAAGVDWGQFDNDGPDGIPNSGDDDGYVDVLSVMHPTRGAECDGDRNSDRIWSHRWHLAGWGFLNGFATSTPSASPVTGGVIRVLDYTIQPVRSCHAGEINEIGVFAHELGHGFGLPDLYGTGAEGFELHGGAGYWELMATGSWGCRNGEPERPCAMGAWSKAVLGWVDVVELSPDFDHGTLALDPVEASGTVYRVESGDGSGEYFLLENRQPIGFDANLFAPGLLVWHVDPAVVNQKWGYNGVNADPNHMGVWLRQADGLDQLGDSNRGDDGDPFPGSTGNTELHAGSDPATFTNAGRAMGITLLDIAEAGQEVSFRLLTRYQRLTVATDGVAAGEGLITVDGQALAAPAPAIVSAPFQRHEFEAAPGELVAEGVRNGFLAWEDGSPRVREFQTGLADSTLVARYGRTELLLQVDREGPVPDVEPGTVGFSPLSEGGWYAEGTAVTLTAEPRTGFGFREWSGAATGAQNPTSVVVDEPMTVVAYFDVTYGIAAVPTTVSLEAAAQQEVVFEVENANAPVAWDVEGTLPEGLRMDLEGGRLTGTPLEVGSFPVTVVARDAIGLEARAAVAVVVGPPNLGIEALVGPFLLLAGAFPTPAQREFLDRGGNRNGTYDVGDFRAFVLANPNLPMTADQRTLVRTVVPVGSVGPGRVP